MAPDDLERKAFGTAIAKLRKRRGLTQRELAAAVGVSERAVQSWEQGYSHPYRHLRLLEQALGSFRVDNAAPVTPDDLAAEFRDQIETPTRESNLQRRVTELETRLQDVERRLMQVEKKPSKSRREKA